MLAIIPARGGSKGIPGKNIKRLDGKPLIVYTIQAALAAQSIDRIVLSTDDQSIADIAAQYDIEIPFLRPSELAQDDSLAIDNYIYTIDRLNKEFDSNVTEFAVLLPTSPLRTSADIDNAVELFRKNDADSVISAVGLNHPKEWIFSVNEDGKISRGENDGDNRLINRQKLRPAYIPNGSVYIFQFSLLKEKHTYYSDKTYAYIMPTERAVDIDTEQDFDFAEYLVRKNKLNNHDRQGER